MMQENKQVFCSNRKMIHFSPIFKCTNGKGHPESSNECFKSAGSSEHSAKTVGHLEERVFLLSSRQFGIVLQIKSFVAGMHSASASPLH